ncbi:MAG: acylphosphatase [Methanomassiliicoccus sp.]|jgi:acylphosphatase|nr:acylphosphatase [Methanomassiliicoccus sp.]
MGAMPVRAKARFEGTVQGVSFRAYTRRYAISAGVCGWVRNLPDGSVEAVLEGDQDAIEGVIHRLCTEHPLAVVKKCDVRWEKPTGEFDSFSIRH